MKNYYDDMNIINGDELYDGLLGYGLFSEMLPPFLTSEQFLKYCKNHPDIGEEKGSQYIEYNSMRNINIPRSIGIPSPFNYHTLCKVLSENWDMIKDHFRSKTMNDEYKKSRIHIKKIKNTNAIFEMNYDNWKSDGNPEIDLLKDNKYVVHADISNCFGSIYTHAIPWALVGKEIAKTDRDKTKWFNRIDYAAQSCKYGETNGLLIGPHASNVLSEIILTAIDNELGEKWKYIRKIDDYTCFVKSKDEALKFLTQLNDELRKYNLSLNHKKTSIKELPMALSERWVHKLDNLSIYYRNNRFDYKSIKSYLDNAVDLMNENENNAAILNYAIKCIPSDDMSPNAKEYCVKYVLHLCMLYPYLLRIVDEFVFQRFQVCNDVKCNFVINILFNSQEKRNFDGICYAIYFAIKYCIRIDIDIDLLIENEDCISCLLAYIYCKKNHISDGVLKLYKYAQKIASIEDDFHKNWVFIYELLSSEDLNYNYWKGLKKSNISFLKKEFRII